MDDTFFRKKPVEMLLNIGSNRRVVGTAFASQIAKEIDCTYSHVVKLMGKMESKGLVSFVKTGRMKNVQLTEKGYIGR